MFCRSFLGFDGDIVDGVPEYKILMAEGIYKDGEFTMKRADGRPRIRTHPPATDTPTRTQPLRLSRLQWRLPSTS